MRDLGSVPTIIFGDKLLLAFDSRFMQFNDGKPLEFEAKIDDNGRIVLLGPKLSKPNSTGIIYDNG